MASSGNLKTLFLICDISGSMSENGKDTLMRGVARTVEQFVRLGYGASEIRLVLWNNVAETVEWNPDGELPDRLLNCSGSANAAALCDLLDSASVPDRAVLLLTDGWWSRDDALALKRWKRNQQSDVLRIIKIGSDSNPLLKGDNVFLPDDIFSALDGWLSHAGVTAENEEEDEW